MGSQSRRDLDRSLRRLTSCEQYLSSLINKSSYDVIRTVSRTDFGQAVLDSDVLSLRPSGHIRPPKQLVCRAYVLTDREVGVGGQTKSSQLSLDGAGRMVRD